jgi:hypothetical protein
LGALSHCTRPRGSQGDELAFAVNVGITLAALVTIALALRAPPSVDREPAATTDPSPRAARRGELEHDYEGGINDG